MFAGRFRTSRITDVNALTIEGLMQHEKTRKRQQSPIEEARIQKSSQRKKLLFFPLFIYFCFLFYSSSLFRWLCCIKTQKELQNRQILIVEYNSNFGSNPISSLLFFSWILEINPSMEIDRSSSSSVGCLLSTEFEALLGVSRRVTQQCCRCLLTQVYPGSCVLYLARSTITRPCISSTPRPKTTLFRPDPAFITHTLYPSLPDAHSHPCIIHNYSLSFTLCFSHTHTCKPTSYLPFHFLFT